MLKLIDKKFIICFLIFFLLFLTKSYGELNFITLKNNSIVSLMYHRFDENKYPSTNIKIEDFKKQLKEIEKSGFKYIDIKQIDQIVKKNDNEKYILLTIDDAFQSFYEKAWPILKDKSIPFILFVNTESIGSKGYMNWDQISELIKNQITTIGNHSHSHDYLVDKTKQEITNDLNKAIKIFKKEINKSPIYFSYPFGEWSNSFKEIVMDLNFVYAFGQHSGVIDKSKNIFELPRFPINEKYGKIERFKSIINSMPFPYQKIYPEEKYLKDIDNPPEVKIIFFDNLKNIENITCFSNEGNIWRSSDIKILKKNTIKIVLKDKFKSERGRINCTKREDDGKWRWLGIQFTIKNY